MTTPAETARGATTPSPEAIVSDLLGTTPSLGTIGGLGSDSNANRSEGTTGPTE